jgi:hypothetical protein
MFGVDAPPPPPGARPPPRNNTGRKLGVRRGLAASAAGAVRFLSRRSDPLEVQMERQKLLLEQLEAKTNKTNENKKTILNKKVFIKGLELKLHKKPTGEPWFSNGNRNRNRPSAPAYNLRSTGGIFNAGKIYRHSKNSKLRDQFIRALGQIQDVSDPRRRLQLLRQMNTNGPQNASFKQRLSTYIRNAESNSSRRRSNNNRNGRAKGVVSGNGRGGQQIIFGGGGGQAPPQGQAPPPQAPPQFMAPPQISVAPRINLGGVRAGSNAGPPMPRNMGGGGSPMPRNMGGGGSPMPRNMGGGGSPMPRGLNVGPRETAVIRNAGGPEAVRTAVTALKRANGNVNAAVNASGLPRRTFTAVKNLGGVNAAPRIVASVVRRKHKKRKTPTLKTNRLKKVVHKVPRKNLEKFVLLWALRKKK